MWNWLKEQWHWLSKKVARYTKRITLPLFDGLSLYDVSIFFFRGIIKGSVTSRAGSIAYSFFWLSFQESFSFSP